MSYRFSNFLPDTLPSDRSTGTPAGTGFFAGIDPEKAPVLFDYQSEGIRLLRRSAMSGHTRIMYQAATGSGKTVVAASIIRDALVKFYKQDFTTRNPRAVIFIVPKKDLVSQTAKQFKAAGIADVGLLGDGFRQNLDAPVLVSTWQSLMRLKPLGRANVVLIDEAHSLAQWVRKLMKDPEWSKTVFVGLSATPGTRGLGQFFTDLVIGGTIEELTPKGRLAPFRVFYPEPSKRPDMSKVRTVAGEWHEGQSVEAMSPLTGDIVHNWLARGEDRPTVCFCINRNHGKEVRDAFEKAGIKTGYIDMTTKTDERDEIQRKSKAGEIKVVVNVNCLREGSDWPWLSCLIMAKPVKSTWTYTQIVGRVLRAFNGKEYALVFDHSASTQWFIDNGYVSDIYLLDFDFSLDNGEDGRKASAKKARQKRDPNDPSPCAKCSTMVPAGLGKCPSCGHEEGECLGCGYLKPKGQHRCPCCGREPHKPSGITYEKGELVEVVGKATKKAKATMAEKQAWYSQFLAIASERYKRPAHEETADEAIARHNKRQAWITANYRSKFGVWPKGLRDIPQIPTGEVKNWITAKNIAWAKSRRAS